MSTLCFEMSKVCSKHSSCICIKRTNYYNPLLQCFSTMSALQSLSTCMAVLRQSTIISNCSIHTLTFCTLTLKIPLEPLIPKPCWINWVRFVFLLTAAETGKELPVTANESTDSCQKMKLQCFQYLSASDSTHV